MRIELLQIDKFRNHTHSILEPDAFNVIRGSNFSGKSSIAQAISMCLTPSTMGLDATGRGFATKIQRGATTGKAVLTADIQGKAHLVRRTVTLNTNTTGRTDTVICLDDPDWHPSPFEKNLANNKDVLAVVLNTDRFLLMKEEDQKSLLAKLVLPKQYEFPEETMDAVDKALGEGAIDFDGEPFAVIEKAYKLLYKEREAVNRQVKDFSIPDALPSILGITQLQGDLLAAQQRQKTLTAERDAAIAKNGDASAKVAKLEAKAEALEEKIAAEEGRIAAIERRILSEDKVKILRKVAEGATALKGLEEDRAKILARIERRKERLAVYQKMTGVQDETCPTCYQNITKDSIAEMQQVATSELAGAQKKDSDTLDKMKALGDVHGAVKALEDSDKAVKEKVDIEVVIGEKKKLLQDVNAELHKLPGTTDVLLPFVKPLDEVDTEIQALMLKMRPAIAAEERKKEIDTKTLQLGKLKEKAFSIDLLVKTFDKDGIKATLLTQYIGAFERKFNDVLNAWGYSGTLSIEPFEFSIKDSTGVITPIKELSGSEQLMFAIALQCAVSASAGIGIVIADKLDTFLPSQRSRANKILYTLTQDGTLEQVFAIMSDESESVPSLPNSAFFLVSSGTVRKL